jgi:hypothetical protein
MSNNSLALAPDSFRIATFIAKRSTGSGIATQEGSALPRLTQDKAQKETMAMWNKSIPSTSPLQNY